MLTRITPRRLIDVIQPLRLQSTFDFNYNYQSLQSNLKRVETPLNKVLNGNNISNVLVKQSSSVSSSFTRPQRLPKIDEDETVVCANLRILQSVQEVLDYVESLSEVEIDQKVFVIAFSHLFSMLKNENMTRRKDLVSSIGMQKLLKFLKKHIRYFDPGDNITVLKLFVLLELPSSNFYHQLVLRVLSKQVNSMNLSDIQYMNFLLEKMNPNCNSAITSALKLALPVVFESQLTAQLNPHNIDELVNFLYFASKIQLKGSPIDLIASHLVINKNKLSPKQSMSIIWSLADLKWESAHNDELLAKCFRNVIESFHSYTPTELSTLLSKMAKKYYKGYYKFYNEDFLELQCQKLASRSADQENAVYSLRKVSVLKHLNVEYFDRVAEILLTNPSLILNNDHLFYTVVHCYGSMNYKPENWDKLEKILLEHPAFTKDMEGREIDMAISLLSLGIFPDKLIGKIFSFDFIKTLDLRRTFPDHLISIRNAAKFLYPEYKCPLPPQSTFDEWKNNYKDKRFLNEQLRRSLEAGFGGESYVLNRVFVHGHHIDHVIIMRKGGYPVAMNSCGDDLEQMNLPPESVPILIKILTRGAFSVNAKKIRGTPQLELKILEKIGHPIVSIDIGQWEELHEYERVPYIMSKIKEKSEKMMWNQNSGDVIPS